jgi:hypothetical protein
MFTLFDKRDKRRKTIAGYAEIDIQLGVLLAAVDFEWTCRRAILALSKNPTVTIRQKFSTDYRSFGGLKIGWENEVDDKKSLDSVFSGTAISWSQIDDAMEIRNEIVHGSGDKTSLKEGRYAVYVLETACDILVEYVKVADKDLFKRISRSRSRKMIEEVQDENVRIELRKRMRNSASRLGENHWVNRVNPWKVRANMESKNS